MTEDLVHELRELAAMYDAGGLRLPLALRDAADRLAALEAERDALRGRVEALNKYRAVLEGRE